MPAALFMVFQLDSKGAKESPWLGRAFGTFRGSNFARCGSDELRAWFCALALVFDALRGFLDRCRLDLVRAQGSHSFDLLCTSTPSLQFIHI